jgi:hypothetical protein
MVKELLLHANEILVITKSFEINQDDMADSDFSHQYLPASATMFKFAWQQN